MFNYCLYLEIGKTRKLRGLKALVAKFQWSARQNINYY